MGGAHFEKAQELRDLALNPTTRISPVTRSCVRSSKTRLSLSGPQGLAEISGSHCNPTPDMGIPFSGNGKCRIKKLPSMYIKDCLLSNSSFSW